jgi:hypothetical protein
MSLRLQTGFIRIITREDNKGCELTGPRFMSNPAARSYRAASQRRKSKAKGDGISIAVDVNCTLSLFGSDRRGDRGEKRIRKGITEW